MPKESKVETLRLSKFFQENTDAIKRRSQVTDFEASPYFVHITKETPKETKKKREKRRSLGPQFKGFAKEDQEFSEKQKTYIDRAVTKREDRIKEVECFIGFSPEEIQSSNVLCDKSRKWTKHLEKEPAVCQGFSTQEQFESKSKLSNISKACNSICADIYRNIDRRILSNHMEENPHEKLVCSKFWCQDVNLALKTEDKTWQKNGVVKDNLLPKSKKNGIKNENKTDISRLDRENVIISEIQKLNDELKQLRKIKYAASEEVKLQNSPFFQIKKELIMTPFIPPKSPHHLLEEELYHDPWALLVATIFLNKTSARAARPYVFWFLEENPDPLTVVGKRTEQLETYFGALGLQKTRASQVWRMSHDFLYKEWKKVGELYGIGRYAEDAFRIFCLGDFSVEPKDRYLKIYKAWYEMHEKKSRAKEMNT